MTSSPPPIQRPFVEWRNSQWEVDPVWAQWLQDLRMSVDKFAAAYPTAAALVTTPVALTDGAGVALGTLTTSPIAGDPTKWIGISDNGVTRYIPAW